MTYNIDMGINTSDRFKHTAISLTLLGLITFGTLQLSNCLANKKSSYKKIENIHRFKNEVDSLKLLNESNLHSELIRQIDKAQKTILVTMFSWDNDKTGHEIWESLLAAADRGVIVTIIKDHKWRRSENKKFRESKLKARFRRNKNIILKDGFWVGGKGSSSYHTYKNHAKYWVFDEWTETEAVIVWWMNVWDAYSDWHDYMVFMSWTWISNEIKNHSVQDNMWAFNRTKHLEHNGLTSIKNIVGTNDSGQSHLMERQVKLSFIHLLQNAQERITIEMAYLWDDDITNTLIEQVKKNIKVTIIIPEKADIQDDLNKRTIQEIIKKTWNPDNLEIYLYSKWLHAKAFIVDDKAVIWSANFNIQSTEQLWEVSILFDGSKSQLAASIVAQLDRQLQQDMQTSKKAQCLEDVRYNIIKAFGEWLFGDIIMQ